MYVYIMYFFHLLLLFVYKLFIQSLNHARTY